MLYCIWNFVSHVIITRLRTKIIGCNLCILIFFFFIVYQPCKGTILSFFLILQWDLNKVSSRLQLTKQGCASSCLIRIDGCCLLTLTSDDPLPLPADSQFIDSITWKLNISLLFCTFNKIQKTRYIRISSKAIELYIYLYKIILII